MDDILYLIEEGTPEFDQCMRDFPHEVKMDWVHFRNNHTMDALQWAEDNIGPPYMTGGILPVSHKVVIHLHSPEGQWILVNQFVYRFARHQDAVLFKLTWV